MKSKANGEVYRRVSERKRKGNVIITSKSKRNDKEVKGIIKFFSKKEDTSTWPAGSTQETRDWRIL